MTTPATNNATASHTLNNTTPTNHPLRHIWVVTGPAGCGKSTVGQFLASQLHLPLVEGDDYHPPENVKKMKSGIPLHDADRWDWLVILRQHCVAQLGAGVPGVVLTCSALKRKYRDVIRIASYYDPAVRVHFLYLRAEQDVLLQRVKGRTGHYMKDDMMQSQFVDLEEPDRDETDCVFINVSGSVDVVQNLALDTVQTLTRA